ncbi:MAG: hypothetical protein ACO25O_05410 [Candidatus Limnocylindrus sp.]|jgi:hypothetical protein
MCHQITCTRCGKPTWEGCGQHIEIALKNVPANERCSCPRPDPNDPQHQKGLLDRILGR